MVNGVDFKFGAIVTKRVFLASVITIVENGSTSNVYSNS